MSSNEHLPVPDSPDEAAVEIMDEDMIRAMESFDSRTQLLEGTVRGGKIEVLRLRPRFEGHLELHIDAEDHDGDGLPELPADGLSATAVTARLTNEKGKPIRDADVLVRFRVSRGTLSKRAVKSAHGEASVNFTPPTETTRATISALAEGYPRADIRLEMIPVDEYQAVAKKPRAKGH
jgi:hypothetical protein